MNGPMERVVVTDYNFPSLKREREILEPLGATVDARKCQDEEDVARAVAGARVVLNQFAPMTRKVIEAMEPGSTIIRYGIGVDNIDLPGVRARNVAVANVPDYCIEEVADHTATLLLSLLRKLPFLDRDVQAGRWDPVGGSRPLPAMRDVTVGLVGLGRIGQGVVQRLRPFGCRFLAYDPFVAVSTANELDVELKGLDEVVDRVDALTLHVPLTQQTRNLLNRERLFRMKPTALVVNTARGGLIDTAALSDVLSKRRLGGAALDVFDVEPLPVDSPLRGMDNVVLTPHVAWYSEESLKNLQRLAAEEAARALQGRPLRCPVEA